MKISLRSIFKIVQDHSSPVILNAFIGHLYDKIIQKLPSEASVQLKSDLKNERAKIESGLMSRSDIQKLAEPAIYRNKIYTLKKAGKLIALKVGKRIFYPITSIFTFLNSVEKKPPKRLRLSYKHFFIPLLIVLWLEMILGPYLLLSLNYLEIF